VGKGVPLPYGKRLSDLQSVNIGSRSTTSIGVLCPWVKRPQSEADHLAPFRGQSLLLAD